MPAEINYLAIKDSLREDGNFGGGGEGPAAAGGGGGGGARGLFLSQPIQGD